MQNAEAIMCLSYWVLNRPTMLHSDTVHRIHFWVFTTEGRGCQNGRGGGASWMEILNVWSKEMLQKCVRLCERDIVWGNFTVFHTFPEPETNKFLTCFGVVWLMEKTSLTSLRLHPSGNWTQPWSIVWRRWRGGWRSMWTDALTLWSRSWRGHCWAFCRSSYSAREAWAAQWENRPPLLLLKRRPQQEPRTELHTATRLTWHITSTPFCLWRFSNRVRGKAELTHRFVQVSAFQRCSLCNVSNGLCLSSVGKRTWPCLMSCM